MMIISNLFMTLVILLFTAASFVSQNLYQVKSDIIRNGLNEELFNSYINYLISSNINFDTEEEFIKDNLLSEYEKDFAYGIILKKQNKFSEAYGKLLTQLNYKHNEALFYEELVWTAKVSDNLEYLKSELRNLQSNKKLLLLGLIEFHMGNYSEAIKNFNDFLNFQNSDFKTNYWISYCYRYLGNYQNALLELNNADRKMDSSSFYYSQILNAKGSLYYLSDNYQKAEHFYKKAYTNSKRSGNNIELIKSKINLAILADLHGKLEDARDLLKRAYKISENINALDLQGIINSELGVSYTYDEQLLLAESHYIKALENYTQLNEISRISVLHNNLGKIYLSMFNYSSALEEFQKGLETANENIRSKILNLISMGDVFSNLSNFSQALDYYQNAKKLSREIKEISLEFEVEMGLGILEFNLGRYNNSLEIFNNAVKLINTDADRFAYADILHKIAITEYALFDYENAEKHFLKSAQISQELGDIYTEILVKLDLAELYLDNGQMLDIKKVLSGIEPIIEEYGLDYIDAKTKYMYGKIFGTKYQIDKAIEKFAETVTLSEKLNEDNLLIEANFELGKIYYGKNEIQTAEDYYINSIDLIEKKSNKLFNNQDIQISHFSKYNEIYDSFIQMKIDNHNTVDAFAILDNSRSRNTFQNLLYHRVKSGTDDQSLNKYIRLKWLSNNTLDKAKKDSINAELASLKNKMIYENIDLTYLLGERSYFTISEKQKALKPDETFISLFVNDDYTQFFFITDSDIDQIKVDYGREQIINLVSQISPYYSSDSSNIEIIFNQDLFAYNSQKSYELYVELFEKAFQKISTEKMIFSLPEELLNFPLETLVVSYNNNDSPYEYHKMEYLINKYMISYSPSLQVYTALHRSERNAQQENLLIGDPVVDNNDYFVSFRSSIIGESQVSKRNLLLNPLKYSKEEINSISSYMENPIIILSEEATENNFKQYAHQSNIIHISSHSFLINQQPFIVFSRTEAEDQDGFLEKGEILDLNLNSNLVVLSSCKSGLGKIDRQEGILGMQKSFFDAGAKSIVVSLWDVNDKYTYLFMELFYRNLSEGMNKSSALQRSKIEFMKKYSYNPYYWGAFVLSGDIGEVGMSNKDNDNLIWLLVIIALTIILIGSANYIKRFRLQE